jgi:hypothetical protein
MAFEDTVTRRGDNGNRKLRLKLTFKETTSLEYNEEQIEAFKAFLTNARLEIPGFGRIFPTEFSLEEENLDNLTAARSVSQNNLKDLQLDQTNNKGYYYPINIITRCTNPASPTQYEGTINGRAFYFRYVHGFWSLIIYQVQQGRPYYVEGLAGSRDDSRMEENEVLAILRGCAHDCLSSLLALKKYEQTSPVNWFEIEQDSFIY